MRRFVVVLGLLAAGCGDDQQPDEARALWEQIHADGYRTWARPPGYETRQPGTGPHGDHIDIFVNGVMADAFAAGEPLAAWPHGSTIVKDGFDGSTFELVAVMQKRGSDWFWAEYDDEGDAHYSGKPSVCIDCHASGEDMVRAFGLPK